MTIEAVTPLRQRMIEDMNARKLCAGTRGGTFAPAEAGPCRLPGEIQPREPPRWPKYLSRKVYTKEKEPRMTTRLAVL
jgi:hypothetical protein